ncbi:RNA-binding domain-containing protein [Hyaloscypha hepaticicola]|uniref:RNA-binding domain-containing protein n=1 Tax=Hyaloscypha hepaticicola TaxID=2082293 RepID=A0A2J6QEV0_9HELO|nr:RNA-binding domain-containing protein [Hyaloscypha hepaticicola]
MAQTLARTAQTPGTRKPNLPPNQTLYVSNLPSNKIQKEDLRRSLYMLFSTYGPVLDVVALRTMKMRGQAHIVYRDVQTATQAMRALQGFQFFGKDMEIQYAKTKSDTIAKLDGTFRMPSAAAGAVTATELQQSIFNAPPSAATTTSASLPPNPLLKPPPSAADHAMEDARSPTNSVAGQKRRRDEEEEAEEDSEGDVAMEEDSDDE